MQRWETWTALAAVVLASLSALSFPGHLVLAGAAILLIVVVGTSRLRAARHQRRRTGPDPYDVARRIREERSRRFRH